MSQLRQTSCHCSTPITYPGNRLIRAVKLPRSRTFLSRLPFCLLPVLRLYFAKMRGNGVPQKGQYGHSLPLMALDRGHDGHGHGSSYPRMPLLAPRFGEHRLSPMPPSPLTTVCRASAAACLDSLPPPAAGEWSPQAGSNLSPAGASNTNTERFMEYDLNGNRTLNSRTGLEFTYIFLTCLEK